MTHLRKCNLGEVKLSGKGGGRVRGAWVWMALMTVAVIECIEEKDEELL